MSSQLKSGQMVRVTVSKPITREAAEKTLVRLFMKDKSLSAPIEARTANFADRPKRRGGRIWTKRPTKIHLKIAKGSTARIKVTPQAIKDLASVASFVEVSAD